MLRNLAAEMARQGLTNTDIAKIIGKSDRSVRDKIKGKYDFSIPEGRKIRDCCFPGFTLEYLFTRDDPVDDSGDSRERV